MKIIKLGGKTDEVMFVDNEDFERVNKYKWRLNQVIHSKYGLGRIEDKKTGKKRSVMAHRFVLNLEDKLTIDHIDRNGLNNQKSNLRIATPSENQHNRGLNKNNTSGYKGVTFNKMAKKWQSQIRYEYKTLYLGCFENQKEAAVEYDKKAKELFGEFALLNFK